MKRLSLLPQQCILLMSCLLVALEAVPIDIDKTKVKGEGHVEGEKIENPDTGLYYDEYLRQVIDVLETDKHFREKLQTADIEEIKVDINKDRLVTLEEFLREDTARRSQELLDGKQTFNPDPGEQHSCSSRNTIKACLGQLHTPTNLIVLNTKKEILVLTNSLTNSFGFKGS